MVTPTTLEQTRIDTVVDEALPRPMLLRARFDTTTALGWADCAGEEVPWIAYSNELRAAEFNERATKKK
jgi:hypothetical protein